MDVESLEPGGIYLVDARQFSVAIWTGTHFRGPRLQHKNWSFDDELPWEAGTFGTATAKERVAGSDTLLRAPYDGFNLLQVMIAFNTYYESFTNKQSTIDGEE